jgi:hypothetical protein
MQDFGARGHGRAEARVDLVSAGRREGDVGLAEAVATVVLADPEVGLRWHAVADRDPAS